jgi:hypothetical protein
VRRSTRSLAFLALLALIVAVWLPRLRGPIDLRWDGGVYYVLGTALAQGQGYRLLNEPGEIEAVQYPPLLPAIVALHQLVLGTSDPLVVGNWLRLTFFLMFAAHTLSSYVLLRRFLPNGYAFAGVAVCVLHLFTMFLSDLLSAELPFALASVLFVLWSAGPGARRHPVAAAVCATCAYLLRTAGIALLIAWVGDSLVRREFKLAALRCAIAMLPIVGWQAYVAEVQAGASYAAPAYSYQRADYLFYNVSYGTNLALRDPYRPELGKASPADLGWRVVSNLIRLPRSLGEAVSASRGRWQALLARVPGLRAVAWERSGLALATAAVAFLGLVVLAGLALHLARPDRLIALYVVLYAGTVCLTPWPLQLKRYWSPLAPFLVLFLLQCLLFVRSRAWPGGPVLIRAITRMLPATMVCVVLMVQTFIVLDAYRTSSGDVVLHDRRGSPVQFRLFFYTRPDRELDEALEWLRPRVRPADVVAAAMPHWTYLVTGAKTVMPPFEADPQEAGALLDGVPVKYIVLDGTDVDIAHLMRRSTVEMLRAAPARWTEIYKSSSGEVAVYERSAEPTEGAATGRAKADR